MCKSCVLCAQCWQKDYVTTLAALNDVTQPMLARGRADDTEDVMRNRMKVYAEETAPLLTHYAGSITEIDGMGEVTAVHSQVLSKLGK